MLKNNNVALSDNQFLSIIQHPSSKFALKTLVESDYQGFIDKVRSYESSSLVYVAIGDGNFKCLYNIPQFMLDVIPARSLFGYMLEYGFKSSTFNVDVFRNSEVFRKFLAASSEFMDDSKVSDFLNALDEQTLGLFLTNDSFTKHLNVVLCGLDDEVLENVLTGGKLGVGVVNQLMLLSEEAREKITNGIAGLNSVGINKLLNNFDKEVASYFASDTALQGKLIASFSGVEEISSMLMNIPRVSLDNLVALPVVQSQIRSVTSQLSDGKENDTFLKLAIKSGSIAFAKCIFDEDGMINKLTPTQKTSMVKWFVWEKVASPELLQYLLSVKEFAGVDAQVDLQLDYASRLHQAFRFAHGEGRYEDCLAIFKGIPALYVQLKNDEYSELLSSSPLPKCIIAEKLSGDTTADCQSLASKVTSQQVDELSDECVAPVAESSPSAPASAPHAPAPSPLWTLSVWAAWGVSVGISTLAVVREASRYNNGLDTTWFLANPVAVHYEQNKVTWLAALGVTASYAVVCGTFIAGETSDTTPDVY